MILCWRTLLVITKHPDDGPGIAKWITSQPDWLHSSEEALLIRSEQCQNTKNSRSGHWKWLWIADGDLPPSFEKIRQAKSQTTQVWHRKAERSECVGNLPSYDRRGVCTSHHHEQWKYRHGFNDHHLQHSSAWNNQEILGKHHQKKTGSLQKFLTCATKGENWERNDSNLKDPRNTRKWTNNIKRCMKKAKEN